MVYPQWTPRPPQCSVSNTWPSKLPSNLHSQSLSVSAVDTEAVKSYHIPYKRLFSLKAKSCELEGHVRTSPLPCCSGSPLWTSVCICRKMELPLLARGSTEPCRQMSRTCYPSTSTLLFYSHSSVSPVLYSEVTLWGRFVAIGAIIAIIWLSSTNLSNVIVLQDQFLEQDRFLSAFLGNLGQQASHFSPEMGA